MFKRRSDSINNLVDVFDNTVDLCWDNKVLSDSIEYTIENSILYKPKIAFIYDEDYLTAYQKAELLREKYDVSLFERPKKMKIFLDKLQNSGFSGFTSDMDIKMF